MDLRSGSLSAFAISTTFASDRMMVPSATPSSRSLKPHTGMAVTLLTENRWGIDRMTLAGVLSWIRTWGSKRHDGGSPSAKVSTPRIVPINKAPKPKRARTS